MAGDASAYAALGLDPGADAAAIDQAYKRLIKQHHPDRQGGDSRRAAEITKAYRELRRSTRFKDPLEFNEDFSAREPRGRAWAVAVFVAAAALGVGFMVAGPAASVDRSLWPAAPRLRFTHAAAAAGLSDPMTEPLRQHAIDRAVRDAVSISRNGDEMALARESRDCHHDLRSDPSLAKLDRCVAFDDAVVELEDRDPLRDQGPFAQLAVTGRQWSGATTLSSDYVAIDGRLDQIRLRVEIALAPTLSVDPQLIAPVAPNAEQQPTMSRSQCRKKSRAPCQAAFHSRQRPRSTATI